jgi:glutamine synthetase
MTIDIDLSKFTLGAEIEFFLLTPEGQPVADIESGKFPVKNYAILGEYEEAVDAVKAELAADYSLQDESGAGQFEANFTPNNDPKELAEEIQQFKIAAKKVAEKQCLRASFAAKPIVGQPGNALHIHYCNEAFDPYGLAANAGVMDVRVAKNNDYVLWAIGGLLAQARDNLDLFKNGHDDMRRFLPWYNAPTKLCWGANNRSVAIRIPDSKPKRIEHRIACADVEPLPLIEHIVAAAKYGMENMIQPPSQVYGNAWQDKYDFEWIFI